MIRRALLIIAGAVVALAAVVVIRTLQVPAPPSGAPGTAAAAIEVDSATAVARLAGAVRFRTVSMASGAPVDTAAFLGLHDFLAKSFPRVTATTTREVVNKLSLLYTWKGTDTTLAPVVIMGHMDVVPVPEENLKEWQHDPFSGDVADGYVWGRGTLDDKSTVLSVLEAAEALIGSGYTPPRTIYFTFGHDEEVSGLYGAKKIVELLVSRGVKPALVIDEGGFLTDGALIGVTGTVALVGIAEKGYVTFRVTATAEGGHSSMPTDRTAIGALSRALAALEANQFPYVLDGPILEMVKALAPYQASVSKAAFANLWLTRPLVIRKFSATPLGAALLHTTTAPTMISGGIKDNVLPPEASAVVNFRIRPGETIESVREHIVRVVNDDKVKVELLDNTGVNPSPVSDVHSSAYSLIVDAIHSMRSEQDTPIIPYLVMGGTDAKHWSDHSDKASRFLAIPLGKGDQARIHGVNERLSVAGYTAAVNFFAALMRGVGPL